MSKWIVDVHGEIEGDYELIKKYEESKTDVLDKIKAEIYEEFMTIDGGVHDKSAKKCMQIIDKYKAERSGEE